MNKDKLPLAVLGFGGFALFVAFISGSMWYMSNWAHSSVPTARLQPTVTEPVVSVHPAAGPEAALEGGSRGAAAGEAGAATEAAGADGERNGRGPRIALVIDDWGYEWDMADAFLQFPERLTVAVLPFLPYSQTQAEQALAAGHEVILHMPMEAQNRAIDIGPGGIRTTMDDEEIARRVADALAHIPGVSGLNNHMGSLATGDPRVMRTVLDVVAERGLFFLDSYTAATTVGPEVARAMAVPHAVNQVFLDHEDSEEHILGQIERLLRLAHQRGAAVGIGHVRPNTFKALVKMLPEMRAAGVQFVPVSELLLRPVAGEEGVEWVRGSASAETGGAPSGPLQKSVPDGSAFDPPEESAPDGAASGPPEESAPDRAASGPPEKSAPDGSAFDPPEESAPDSAASGPPEESAPDRAEAGLAATPVPPSISSSTPDSVPAPTPSPASTPASAPDGSAFDPPEESAPDGATLGPPEESAPDGAASGPPEESAPDQVSDPIPDPPADGGVGHPGAGGSGSSAEENGAGSDAEADGSDSAVTIDVNTGPDASLPADPDTSLTPEPDASPTANPDTPLTPKPDASPISNPDTSQTADPATEPEADSIPSPLAGSGPEAD